VGREPRAGVEVKRQAMRYFTITITITCTLQAHILGFELGM
jgi:hypothetical protein